MTDAVSDVQRIYKINQNQNEFPLLDKQIWNVFLNMSPRNSVLLLELQNKIYRLAYVPR